MLGRKVSNKSVITNDHDDDYDELLSSIEHFYEIQNAAHHGRDTAKVQAHAEETATRAVKLFRHLTSFLRRAIPQDGLPEPRRAKSWPIVNFVIRTYSNLALTFLFDGKMLIFSPVNALLFLTVYPFMIVLLIAVELTLKVFLDYLGGQALVTYLSVRYGGGKSAADDDVYAISKKSLNTMMTCVGFSPVNWGNDFLIQAIAILPSMLVY